MAPHPGWGLGARLARPWPKCRNAPRSLRKAAALPGPRNLRGYHRQPDHGPAAHPQLLDHRAHRPRQVDARRPHPRADACRLAARYARPGARLDGSRARARDHDQGPGRAGRLEGPPAEPDRHARPRRLHLRGLALAAGVRGRAARRRRGAGDRGADARERLSRDREQPRDRPGREQDRPAAGRSRRRRRSSSPNCSATTRRACCGSRRRPGIGVEDVLDAIIERIPAPVRRPRRAGTRADLRLVLRPVPRRGRVRPRRRRRRSSRARTCARWRSARASRRRRSARCRPRCARSKTLARRRGRLRRSPG